MILLKQGCRRIIQLPVFVCNRTWTSSSHTELEEKRRETRDQFFEQYNAKPFERLTPQNFASLIRNAEDERRVAQILEIYEQSKQSEAILMPKTLTEFNMENLLHIQSDRTKTLLYLAYCGKQEKSFLRKKFVKQVRQAQRQAEQPTFTRSDDFQAGIQFDSEGTPQYGLWRNTMFARNSNREFNAVHRSRLLRSAMFGQKLVIDFSYQHLMPPSDYSGICKQAQRMFMANYEEANPFDLWFCNFPYESRVHSQLKRIAPNLLRPDSMLNVTERSFLNIGVDRERLVYLSPDAPDKLDEFRHDDVYVLGAFIDRNDNRPQSLMRAQEANIRSARLPLEDHVIWKNDNANLPMLNVFRMLLHVKQSYGCWKHAIIQFVPPSKQLDEFETIAKYQPKLFETLMRRERAYVYSRQTVRDRLLKNKVRKAGLI